MNIVEVEGLKKSFGEVRAVDGVSFCVREGALFAFLGLNGAGKSTTINILCSILQKDAGKVRIAGLDLDRDAHEIKKQVGIIFQNSVLDQLLSVRENLATRAAYYGLRGAALKSRIDELEGLLDLGELMKRPYGKLSGGQRRRVDIARALLMHPRLLFLDEPTTGLDPQTRRSVWGIIERLQRETGMTAFLTTHYMEEAEKADDVVIMDAGRIAARGTPHELKTNYSGNYIFAYGSRNERFLQVLHGDCVAAERAGDGVKIKVSSSAEARAVIVKYGEYLSDFEVKKGNMDDVFLNVTGKVLENG